MVYILSADNLYKHRKKDTFWTVFYLRNRKKNTKFINYFKFQQKTEICRTYENPKKNIIYNS